MKPFQKPYQYTESTNLFFQRPVNRSTQDIVPKDNCYLFGIQHTQNTFKRQHTYSFK